MMQSNKLPVASREMSACLAAAGREQVLSTAALLTQGMTVLPLLPAESGLALLQWTDAVLHQPFFLGEVPMARAALALINPLGERAEGAAVLMADDTELAEALARLDAISARRWPGAEQVDALAQSGALARARLRTERQAMLRRTRVDFALLTQADDDGEDVA